MNPFKKGTQGFIDAIEASTTASFNPKADPHFNEELPADTDVSSAVSVEFSIGSGGRGNSIVRLTGADVSPVIEALKAFDPAEDLSSLTPAECIFRTIATDEDGVTFKTSLAKNARTHTIPTEHWEAFLGLLARLDGSIEPMIDSFRVQTEEANEAAAKKAAQPARTEGAPNPEGTPNGAPKRRGRPPGSGKKNTEVATVAPATAQTDGQ